MVTAIPLSFSHDSSEKGVVYFSPNKNNEAVVVKFISDSKVSLDVAIYSITNKSISDAIKLAKKRFVKSRVLCDKQQVSVKTSKCKDVGGVTDNRSGLMHHKFIIRDNKCVLTGSFNFTDNAIYRNRENFIIICDEEVARKYTDEFNNLWKNNP